jgi:uncharacterized Rmd1/YagE family protein
MGEHNLKSKSNEGKHRRKTTLMPRSMQTNKVVIIVIIIIIIIFSLTQIYVVIEN